MKYLITDADGYIQKVVQCSITNLAANKLGGPVYALPDAIQHIDDGELYVVDGVITVRPDAPEETDPEGLAGTDLSDGLITEFPVEEPVPDDTTTIDLQAQIQTLQAQVAALQGPVVDGVPQIISKYQGVSEMKARGLLDGILAYMATLEPTDDARIAWDMATTWHRTSPFIATLGATLGLNDAAIDAMFVEASAY